MKHRIPPKPPYFDNPAPGQCKWCGLDITKPDGTLNKRSHWHPSCVEEYKILFWPKVTRMAVYRRDKAICAGCGCHCSRAMWHMDHIRPLIEAHGNLDFWRLSNLQTLCEDCHIKKTSQEATERAKIRREKKKKI